MKLDIIIDPMSEEGITAVVHAEGALTEALRRLASEDDPTDVLTVYRGRDTKRLPLEDVACISVQDGKLTVVDAKGEIFFVKGRLYELESRLPHCFIRINKSAIANEKQIERFRATLGGGVDAVFHSGYKEYVSRRCFAEIKRRFSEK